jgi:hypothetical protein
MGPRHLGRQRGRSVFPVLTAHTVTQRPLQDLPLIPEGAHPEIALFIGGAVSDTAALKPAKVRREELAESHTSRAATEDFTIVLVTLDRVGDRAFRPITKWR